MVVFSFVSVAFLFISVNCYEKSLQLFHGLNSDNLANGYACREGMICTAL